MKTTLVATVIDSGMDQNQLALGLSLEIIKEFLFFSRTVRLVEHKCASAEAIA